MSETKDTRLRDRLAEEHCEDLIYTKSVAREGFIFGYDARDAEVSRLKRQLAYAKEVMFAWGLPEDVQRAYVEIDRIGKEEGV